MKRKFTKLLMLVVAFAFIFSAAAQHNARTDLRQKVSSVKKNVPNDWSRSTNVVVFSEDFSNNGFDNWTVMGEGNDNWSASDTDHAGGELPEALMSFSPVFTGTSRLVSPVINTSGYSNLNLSFLHVLDLWTGGGGFWVSVETTSDGGTTWNQVWELNWTTVDDYYAFEVLALNTPDVGSDNFQFCFKFEDNSDLLDFWAIDNVTLEVPFLYDVTPTAILGLEGIINNGNDVTVSSTINNYGSETVTFDVKMEIDDGSNVIFTSTKTVTDLAWGEQITVDFDTWSSLEGNYTAIVTTMLSGDENTANDELAEPFVVYGSNTYCFPGGD